MADELNINPDIVHEVIDRAREFQAQEAVSIPEEVGEISEEDFNQILADHENNMTFQEVQEAIDSLEPDQQIELVALMYLGRGDFEEWDEALQEAKDGWTDHTAQYLLSKPQVAEYLQAGLEELGYNEEF